MAIKWAKKRRYGAKIPKKKYPRYKTPVMATLRHLECFRMFTSQHAVMKRVRSLRLIERTCKTGWARRISLVSDLQWIPDRCRKTRACQPRKAREKSETNQWCMHKYVSKYKTLKWLIMTFNLGLHCSCGDLMLLLMLCRLHQWLNINCERTRKAAEIG